MDTAAHQARNATDANPTGAWIGWRFTFKRGVLVTAANHLDRKAAARQVNRHVHR